MAGLTVPSIATDLCCLDAADEDGDTTEQEFNMSNRVALLALTLLRSTRVKLLSGASAMYLRTTKLPHCSKAHYDSGGHVQRSQVASTSDAP